ncbi:MAG: thymidine phosphorylase [Ruminococcaceae bacterium]|nr:thymidine phosphorylase [Oscillospiraceae bacterium]
MNIIEIIEKKKNKQALSEAEIAFFVDGICTGSIADYQASALLMAICLNGMTAAETAILTDKMAHSGDTLDLTALSPTADKHSTGGVGDKTSLIVAPIAAACGVNIAKMSGRGLGHTGGTIDKLESIPGFRTTISENDFLEQVKNIGIAIVAQSKNLVPADKILYALRDVTGTVESIPLIASSIMSKKLAAGADVIELDVKVGSGAFMKTPQEARELAAAMVDIGKKNGRKTAALITDMDEPLGTHIGNTLEIKEVIATLNGGGAEDLRTLCLGLAANIIALAENIEKESARRLAEEALRSGKALEKFKQMVAAQGGNVRYIENPALFEEAAFAHPIAASQSGYIQKTDAQRIGETAALLGAGRQKMEDSIDFAAGIILEKKCGEYVAAGDTIATLYTNQKESLAPAAERFLSALTIGKTSPQKPPLIQGEVL